MYDLIGDIHGHADELEQLLEALDYEKAQGVYRHSERVLGQDCRPAMRALYGACRVRDRVAY